MANNKFFTNTYITGSGRRNYTRIDNLEDPLFTSFTFDIDFITSPLFYTVNYSDYGYPNINGMSERIETSLDSMYGQYISIDQGYDILPVYSANMIDGNKLGFGLQQNVFMDTPIYGATEYIYMVDKRNGGSDQNDVRYDNSNIYTPDGRGGVSGPGGSGSIGNVNSGNSYTLGSNGIQQIVNESDKKWAENKQKQCAQQISACNDIMEETADEHKKNYEDMSAAEQEYSNSKEIIKDENGNNIEYTEEDLEKKVYEYKIINENFEKLKIDIIDWVNSNLAKYKNRGTSVYKENSCVQKIYSYDNIGYDNKKEDCVAALKKEFGENFRKEKLFEDSTSYLGNFKNIYNDFICDENNTTSWHTKSENSFLIDKTKDDGRSIVRQSKIIENFKDDLKKYDLYNETNDNFNGDVCIDYGNTPPDWVYKTETHLDLFKESGDYNSVYKTIKDIMTAQCDATMAFTAEFTSEKIKENEKKLGEYETALKNIKYKLYGTVDDNPCDKNNPTSDSLYGKYLESKNKYENDDYSQAEKTKKLAESGELETSAMLSNYNKNTNTGGTPNVEVGGSDKEDDKPENDSGNSDSTNNNGNSESWSDGSDSDYDDSQNEDDTNGLQSEVQSQNERPAPPIAPQTVVDMLGFISGMKKMTQEYPYIIQSITGLDTAYKNHYMIKDPYLGSGDDKITLTCLESLDLRVSSMFNRYFNAVYDRQYRRERVPINLRRFNCSVYVHDVRNFVAKNNFDQIVENRIIELSDMYYSVIEFRFYECEIVPEETGNIFNDISNEAPTEIKKTNFTFTYGNCVVNFVPISELEMKTNIIR